MAGDDRTGRAYLVLALAYTAVLTALLVAPLGGVPHHPPSRFLGTGAGVPRHHLVPDVLLNVALFVPFGFLLHGALRAWGCRALLAAVSVVAVVGLFALGVESVQYLLPSRYSSILDVATNVVGAGIGAAVHGLVAARPSR